MINIAGIDVGVSGAITIMNEHFKIIDCIYMPIISYKKDKRTKTEYDAVLIKKYLSKHKVQHCAIEKAQVMPRQGVVSQGNYMMGFGLLKGICVGLAIPYTLIHPKTWKKVLMRDMGKEKGASVLRVKQLYPDIELPLKRDHNKADSILIARYFCVVENFVVSHSLARKRRNKTKEG